MDLYEQHRDDHGLAAQALRRIQVPCAVEADTFDDAKGIALVGTIIRVNSRTATLQAMGGRNCRLGFELLSHIAEF